MKNSYTIAIFGSYGGHNAGDDAILSSIIRDVSRSIDGVNFYKFASAPDADQWFLRAMLESEVAGDHDFDDISPLCSK